MTTNIIATLEDSRERVNVGDRVTTFRGEVYTVSGFSAPRGSSTGRVYTVEGSGFYPSVFGIVLTVEDRSGDIPQVNDYDRLSYVLVDSALGGINGALSALRSVDFDGVEAILDNLHEAHQRLHEVYMTKFDN